MLLQHPGTLLSKERFLQDVWQGILLIDSILHHAENDLNRRPFGEEWREINGELSASGS